jgi:hypothetical protein
VQTRPCGKDASEISINGARIIGAVARNIRQPE